MKRKFKENGAVKRTIILAAISFFVIILFSGLSNIVVPSGQDTCCQRFRVLNGGNPVPDCTIYYGAGVGQSCVTNDNGECEICDLTVGNQYSVTADCTALPPITFTACGPTIIIGQ